MREVWKFPLGYSDYVWVSMPEGAEPLHIDMDGPIPMLWALVNPNNAYVQRKFRFAGTGHAIQDEDLKYVGTTRDEELHLVWHLFEVNP